MALKSGRVGIHPSQVDPITGMLTVDLGASKLSDLDDINISSPSNNQALTYNSSTQKWRNSTLANVARTGSFNDLSNKPSGYGYFSVWDERAKINREYGRVSGLSANANVILTGSVYNFKEGYYWTEGVSAAIGATTVNINDPWFISEDLVIEVFTKNSSNTQMAAPEIHLNSTSYNFILNIPDGYTLSATQPSEVSFEALTSNSYIAYLSGSDIQDLKANGISIEAPGGLVDTVSLAGFTFDSAKVNILSIDRNSATFMIADQAYYVTLVFPALTEATTFYLRVTPGIGGN